MRQMFSKKQIDNEIKNIAVKRSKDGINKTNAPEFINIPFDNLFYEGVYQVLSDRYEEELIDFENHQCIEGLSLDYYLNKNIKMDNIEVQYYFEEEYCTYITLTSDDTFSFPESINTLEELTEWIVKNGFPEEIRSGVYSEGGYAISLDDLDNEIDYEYYGVISYKGNTVLGKFKRFENDILNIGSSLSPISIAYTKTLNTTSLNAPNINCSTQLNTKNIYNSNMITSTYIGNSGNSRVVSIFAKNLGSNTSANHNVEKAYIQDPHVINTLWFDNEDHPAMKFGVGGFEIEVDNEDYFKSYITSVFPLQIAADDKVLIQSGDSEVEIKADTYVKISGLPTSDPHVADALWNDNGVLKISAGA